MAIFNQIGGISTSSITGALSGPLASLFGTKGAQVYQYPDNLTNDPTRQHWVQFVVYNTTPTNFQSSSTTTIGANSASSEQDSNSGGLISSITSSLPTNIGSAVNSFFGIGGSQSGPNTTVEAGEIQTIINLYMPDTLQVSYKNNWEEVSLQSATMGVGRIIEGIESISAQFEKNKSQKMSFADNISSISQGRSPEEVEAIVGVLSGGDKDAVGAALGKIGVAVNPQLQMVYRGVDFRTFQLEFLMTPKSPSEADMVSRIVNAFVYSSSPDIKPDSSNMYFIPPSKYDVSFRMATNSASKGFMDAIASAGNSIIPGLPLGNAITGMLGGGSSTAKNKGSENGRLMKFGKSILTNVNVDYSPNGWAAHPGGVPLQTRLTLEFQELEIIHRGRMESGQIR